MVRLDFRQALIFWFVQLTNSYNELIGVVIHRGILRGYPKKMLVVDGQHSRRVLRREAAELSGGFVDA